MPSPRMPRSPQSINYSDHRDLFATYSPTFFDNVSLGYVRDGYTQSYRERRLGVLLADGELPAKELALHPKMPTIPHTPGISEVTVVSTDARDTGLIAVVGTNVTGDEVMGLLFMTGDTPLLVAPPAQTVGDPYYFISVHYMLYIPYLPDHEERNHGLITTNGMLDPARSVSISPEEGKGCNNIFRCPKWQKAIIPQVRISTVGEVTTGGSFMLYTHNYPANAMWYKQATMPVGNAPIVFDLLSQQALEGGDFIQWTVQNESPHMCLDFHYNVSIVQMILDDAPPDYERKWFSVTGMNPWDVIEG